MKDSRNSPARDHHPAVASGGLHTVSVSLAELRQTIRELERELANRTLQEEKSWAAGSRGPSYSWAGFVRQAEGPLERATARFLLLSHSQWLSAALCMVGHPGTCPQCPPPRCAECHLPCPPTDGPAAPEAGVPGKEGDHLRGAGGREHGPGLSSRTVSQRPESQTRRRGGAAGDGGAAAHNASRTNPRPGPVASRSTRVNSRAHARNRPPGNGGAGHLGALGEERWSRPHGQESAVAGLQAAPAVWGVLDGLLHPDRAPCAVGGAGPPAAQQGHRVASPGLLHTLLAPGGRRPPAVLARGGRREGQPGVRVPEDDTLERMGLLGRGGQEGHGILEGRPDGPRRLPAALDPRSQPPSSLQSSWTGT
ncbi:coiled-coil domain-containing protein 188 isoform X2 [Ornithorhynchus anatinus]|uniref:coiled-coil domain-containing protein 188 isoform X2 n=1 Tax=Ornithorhynchus anatinus TaxID=9258 RepID=UPI0010A88A53|nr:coiled-coil domain-containing protein 188 isoform X2 [Ornithorhynchus anatinus]